MNDIISVENLRVAFDGCGGTVEAVRGVSLTVGAGEIFALVGESGCGKSVTAQTLLGLNASPPARIEAAVLRLGGVDLLRATTRELLKVRGGVAGMVFQDPMTCLNPTMRVGHQITERLRRREHWSRARCEAEAVRLLELVQVPDAALRARQYPHQFSGGMRQRAMLAMALAGQLDLLIADEPTTALDTTTQLQILRLLSRVRKELGTAVLLITHDVGVAANLADRVGVMFGGKIVELGDTPTLFSAPAHPYTRELLGHSVPVEIPLRQAENGCRFSSRCRDCMNICLREEPPTLSALVGHGVACWLWEMEKESNDGNFI